MKLADVRNVKLESAELFQCEEDGYFYIKLVYTYEAVDGIHKLIIPKMSTMISNDDIPAITRMCVCRGGTHKGYISRQAIFVETGRHSGIRWHKSCTLG